jgi:hypothetical protein
MEVGKKGKRGKQCLPIESLIIFLGLNPYKPNDLGQLKFIEDLVLLIAKGYLRLSIVENLWLVLSCDSVIGSSFLHANNWFENIFWLYVV